jgi:hypothetical protein
MNDMLISVSDAEVKRRNFHIEIIIIYILKGKIYKLQDLFTIFRSLTSVPEALVSIFQ